MTLQSQLEQILIDLRLLGVETSLMAGAILLLIVGLVTKSVWLHKAVFLATIIVSIALSFTQIGIGAILTKSLYLQQEFLPFTALLMVTLGLILIFPRDGKHSTEFYFLILSLGVGSLFMIKANSLLIIYLCIELVSFVSYILTSFSFKRKAHESAIKYLLFGALSSAIMLFGLGLIYGSTGTFYFSDWDFDTFDTLLSQVGLLFVIFGVFFKISIVPLHIWTPATYQEAPLDAVAVLSILPKIAGVILVKRILVDASLASNHWIIEVCLLLGLMTILVGTLGALRQTNSRRMISFGAVAHSGFMLPFALIVGDTSEQAFWWYAVVYALTNLSVFYLIDRFESKRVIHNTDYSLISKETWIGVAFTFILISLTGLPPVAGFTAKFFLFSSMWESYLLTASNYLLLYLVVAILATVASLFYYLRIPYYQFMASSNASSEASIKISTSTKFIATIFTIVLLLLFFVPKLIAMIHTWLNMRS